MSLPELIHKTTGKVRVSPAAFTAIHRAVAVPVYVLPAAAAHSRVGFVRIVRTAVIAVRCSVTVRIPVRDAAAAVARIDLVRVGRTGVAGIACTVVIGVLPFVGLDALKACMAALVAPALRRAGVVYGPPPGADASRPVC